MPNPVPGAQPASASKPQAATKQPYSATPVRGATQRLQIYQVVGEQALAIAAESIGADQQLRLQERGRALPDASVAALAFADADSETADR